MLKVLHLFNSLWEVFTRLQIKLFIEKNGTGNVIFNILLIYMPNDKTGNLWPPSSNVYCIYNFVGRYFWFSCWYKSDINVNLSLAPQNVFPRSHQYDLDCVKYRRLHACDGLSGDSKVIVMLSINLKLTN